jgi:hypothetical protein
MNWCRCAPVVAALTLTVFVGACGRSAPSAGTLHTSGDVVVDGVVLRSGDTVGVSAGQHVQVVSGSAEVALPGGGHVDLAPGSDLVAGRTPTLVGGDALVEAGSAPLGIVTTLASVSVAGIARLDRDLALTVGTYKGETTVVAGRTVVLPPLTQDTIASVSVAPEPMPLHLDANDLWDQEFLGTAIDLTNQLDSQSRYVTANVTPSLAATPAFYERELRPLAKTAGFTENLIRGGGQAPSAGDGLTAAAIALSGPGNFASRWDAIIALRDAGAQWGIVVLDEAADPAAVLQLVDSAVINAPPVPTPATPIQVVTAPIFPISPSVPQGVPAVATRTVPKPAVGAVAVAPPVPTPSGPPKQVVAPAAPQPPSTMVLAPVLDPIVDPLGALLKGLLGQG